MKETTKELLSQVDQNHDWDLGDVFSGGGTELHSTDTCRVCSLRRHWEKDQQNGTSSTYRFSDGETGRDLSLRQAASRVCLVTA